MQMHTYSKEESDRKAVINRIIEFSNVDGPGNRMAIFLQGCDFNCIYCHNPETINECNLCMECIESCEQGALTVSGDKIAYDKDKCIQCDACIHTCRFSSSPKTTVMSVDDILELVIKCKPYIRGITASGGEPTKQYLFLAELFEQVRKLGLTTLVDTNANFIMSEIQSLIEVTDAFMIDIKEDKAGTVTGSQVNRSFSNLVELLRKNKVLEVRTVVFKGMSESTILRTANLLKDYPQVKYRLIPLHEHGVSDKNIELIRSILPDNAYMEEVLNKALLTGASAYILK